MTPNIAGSATAAIQNIRLPSLLAQEELVATGLLPPTALRQTLLIARQPRHAVHEQVLVAEILDEEVAGELGIAVDDELTVARAPAGRAGDWKLTSAPTPSGPRRSRPAVKVALPVRTTLASAVAQLSLPVDRRAANAVPGMSSRISSTGRVSENSGGAANGARIGCARRS